MPKIKGEASPTFDYAALGDAEAVARDAAERIEARAAAEARAKEAWISHGLDILRVRATAKHGHFLAWVKHQTPFGERIAQMMANAAEMIRRHIESENFADLPPLDKAVTYTLAAPSTPETIRAEFLPRLVSGEKGLRKLVNAALKPESGDRIEVVADNDEKTPLRAEPSKRVVAAVESMSETCGREILSIIEAGEVEALRRALDWRFAAPAVPHADRIADKARAAIRSLPLIEMITSDIPAASDDDSEVDEAQTASRNRLN